MKSHKKKRRRVSIKTSEGRSKNSQPKTIAHALAAAIRSELPHLSKFPLEKEERNRKILSLDEEKTIKFSLANVKEHSEEDTESEEVILLSDSEEEESDTIKKSFSSTDEEDNFYICILDNLVSKPSSMHTEHAFCEENIKENISFLLKYLNSKKNQEITEIFLSIDDMKDLFERKEIIEGGGKGIKKNKVVSTKKLEQACLTEVSNLWKVCASCNLAKSNRDIEDFLKEHLVFGEKFVTDLKKRGGIRTGILMDTIYPKLKKEDAVVIAFGKERIALAPASKLPKRIAIADFVKAWYLSKHRKAFEINKELQGIHMKVNKHLLTGQHKNLEEGSRRSETFVQRTAQVYGVANAVYQRLDDDTDYSDSESDRDQETVGRERNMYDVIAYTQNNSHYLKSIKRLLIQEGCDEVAKKSKVLKNYLGNNTHIQLTIEDWKKIRQGVKKLLSENKGKVTIAQFEGRLEALIEKKSKTFLSVERNTLKNQLKQREEELRRKEKELRHKEKELQHKGEELQRKANKIEQLEGELLQLKRPSVLQGQFFTSSPAKVQRKRRTPQSGRCDGSKPNPKKPGTK